MPGGIHPPLSVIETWRPNYIDPPTRAGLVPALVVTTALALFILSARIFVRGYMQRNMGVDDWVILAAFVPTIALVVCACLAGTIFKFDRHVWDVPPDDFPNQRKITYTLCILYLFASGLIKISILFFFRRLSPAKLGKNYIRIVWCSIGFVIAYMIAFSFAMIFNCTPVSAYWNQLDPEWIASGTKYTCTSEPGGLLAASSVSVVQDFIAALLPMWLFWAISIPFRQKIALGAVFMIGFLVCAIGAVRIYYIYHIFYETYDVPWNTYVLWIWMTVEVLVGSMCASAPALKVFFRHMLEISNTTLWRSRSAYTRNDSGDDYADDDDDDDHEEVHQVQEQLPRRSSTRRNLLPSWRRKEKNGATVTSRSDVEKNTGDDGQHAAWQQKSFASESAESVELQESPVGWAVTTEERRPSTMNAPMSVFRPTPPLPPVAMTRPTTGSSRTNGYEPHDVTPFR